MNRPATLDLEAYLSRIGYRGDLEPTLPVLTALHLAHGTHIPFENLDVLLGRPICLDLPSLQAKLVQGRRGGYCFEQNTLFATVLERLGFAVTRLAARVRFGVQRVLPRTHMLLMVEVAGAPYLADVGFGRAGLLGPVPLAAGLTTRQFAWSYRLVREPGGWLLQWQQQDTWFDLYAFTLEPAYPIDFEMANHYVSTHPASRFVQTLTVMKPTPTARYGLINRDFMMDRGDKVEMRKITDDAEVLPLLAEVFGLEFAAGTKFRIPGD
jgi:N-hydroxyarylamine O-acetyltransferase